MLDANVTNTPPQVVLAFGTAAINKPAGKLSVNGAVKVAALRFGLVSVIVSVDTPAALIMAGTKALLTVGGAGVTKGHSGAETTLVSIVTAPVRARALPEMLAPVVRVMLASARIFPTNDVPVPSVAELPTFQNALQF
jgi:hypothetical protein